MKVFNGWYRKPGRRYGKWMNGETPICTIILTDGLSRQIGLL